MPRYGGYRGFGGNYGPQDIFQSGGGENPFYNKYSPYPDWANGIRDTLNRVWLFKEYRKQEDAAIRRDEEDRKQAEAAQAENQRRWEYEQERKDRESLARIQKWLTAPPKSEPEHAVRQKIAQDLYTQDKFPGGEDGYNRFLLTGQLPPEPKAASPWRAGADAARHKADLAMVNRTAAILHGQRGRLEKGDLPDSGTRLPNVLKALEVLNGAYASIADNPEGVLDDESRGLVHEIIKAPHLAEYGMLSFYPQTVQPEMPGAGESRLGPESIKALEQTEGQVASPSTTLPPMPANLPPDVAKYMKGHPDADWRRVLARYQEWLQENR